MSNGRNGLANFFAFITGAAIGAGLAILFAPQSGKETRRKIKDFGDKVGEEVKENFEKIYEGARDKLRKKPVE